MLETKNLSYAYTSNATLNYPDIAVETGKPMLILGSSGCGKSTLLHLLAGLMKPQQGTVKLGDTDVSALSGANLDSFRGKHVGIIFQAAHFVKSLNVFDNVKLAAYMSGVQVSKQDIMDLLANLGIADKLNRLPQHLSQGEQQRLAIARALIHKPKLLLADEPTSALDDENCKLVCELLISRAKAAGATLVIVTHDTRLKDVIEKHITLN